MSGMIEVDIQVAWQSGAVPDEAAIRRWLAEAIRQARAPAGQDLEVSVRVVDEEEGRALNRQYRGRDYATNVLSFPLHTGGVAEPPAGLPLALGDIVICGPVVVREAGEQGLGNTEHFAHMVVHGALHLLGYDHESEAEAREMEHLEAQILAAGGVGNPYAGERPGPGQN